MDKAHDVEIASISGKFLLLRVDGKDYRIDLAEHSARLAQATAEQRSEFEVTPSGYGIRWPQVDEDLSVDGLIGVTHTRAGRRASA